MEIPDAIALPNLRVIELLASRVAAGDNGICRGPIGRSGDLAAAWKHGADHEILDSAIGHASPVALDLASRALSESWLTILSLAEAGCWEVI